MMMSFFTGLSALGKRFFQAALIPALALLFLTAGGQGETVYVTNSGKKYHRDGCPSLSYSKIAVSLADAVKSGYGSCSLCGPPVLNAAPSGEAPVLYRVNAAGLKNTGAGNIGLMLKADVVDPIDGDTVRARIPNPPEGLGVVEIVRLLGVDTPETRRPNQPVQPFGEEAGNFTRDKLLGKSVYLAFDWDLRDRYGRLLAYLYTGAGQCFNALLIREGYGRAYLEYAFQFMDEFRGLELEARRKGRGLWADG